MNKPFLYFFVLSSFVSLALGYFGTLHPLGDSLAVFRAPNIAAALVFSLLLWKSKARYAAPFFTLPILALSAASIAVHYSGGSTALEEARPYRLYQKNLLFLNEDTNSIARDVLQPEVLDFATFQEVSSKTRKLLPELEMDFPYQTMCAFAGVGGVAVISRWPSVPDTSQCFDKDGMAAMQVETPSGPIWLISIHLHWPYPYGQAAQVKSVLEHIEGLEGVKIIAGDFNMVPWSHTLKAFEQVSGTQMTGPAIHSLKLPIIPMKLPIDHVLLPDGARAKVQRRDKLGSDHFGLVASFNLP